MEKNILFLFFAGGGSGSGGSGKHALTFICKIEDRSNKFIGILKKNNLVMCSKNNVMTCF